MDYVVGSVAALISGNVTPNRPKVLKRALTPMKHQPSPNVTPKSELVSDRSIFLSPTTQKKKAIVKKSPKRIFQNPDLDTNDNDDNSSLISPKADKVKKHLKGDLDADISLSILSPKSPKNVLTQSLSPKKSCNIEATQNIQTSNEVTPKKKKKKLSMSSESAGNDNSDKNVTIAIDNINDLNNEIVSAKKVSPKKKRKSSQFTIETVNSANDEQDTSVNTEEKEKMKSKKKTKNTVEISSEVDIKDQDSSVDKENKGQAKKKKNKKRKKNVIDNDQALTEATDTYADNIDKEESRNDDGEPFINPNAVTSQDTDSEHESDNEIESENEENNKSVLDTGPQESSDDEEEKPVNKNEKKQDKEVKEHVETEEEVKRTLFVGNVPFSSKCKKEIKKIFSKYGDIETVRIRTIPVKDARVTPKLAVIKNELHPDRSTVNVYIKYKHPSSINEALIENNTVLNDHHLRVARNDVTGSEHDPKCSVFVGNIPFALEDEGLRVKFEKCGEIESVRIIRDRKTNAGKGFGYINFKSKDGVELALALTEEDLTIKNRILRVKRCTQPTMNRQGKQQNPCKQQNYRKQQNYQTKQYNQGGERRNFPMNSNRNQFRNDRFQRRDQNVDDKGEGAYRRIMNKRKPQEGNDGPPNKKQRDLNQPTKEKKPKKEFVGMTAEKKKFQKKKLSKDQKKKKMLSDILTKQRQ